MTSGGKLKPTDPNSSKKPDENSATTGCFNTYKRHSERKLPLDIAFYLNSEYQQLSGRAKQERTQEKATERLLECAHCSNSSKMPLVINDQVLDHIPENTRSFFDRFPHFKDMNGSLVSQGQKLVGPQGLLYVNQRELAVTLASDKHLSYIGTDDMTTCQCVIIRNTGSGAIGLGHFDGVGTEQGLNNMIRRVQELSHDQYQYSPESKQNRFEVHIIGGFNDNHHTSENVTMQLLYSLQKQAVMLHLVQACCGELNTDFRGTQNWPIVMGVAVNIKTGQIFLASMHDKGPELPLRSTVFYTGNQDSKHVMFDIYDCSLGLMRVGPFSYEPMRAVDLWLQQSDEYILQNLSTSPEVERPHFVMNIRATFKYIQQHPFPGITVFPDNRPHYFRKDEQGLWVPYNTVQTHLY